MLLFGKPVAEKILSETKETIRTSGIVPGLAVVLVGDDPASLIYVGIKEKRAREIGMFFELKKLEKNASEKEIIDCIQTQNARVDIHGIIVQLPLPLGLNPDRILAAIDPAKDADGFLANQKTIPVFPEAMIELAKSSGAPFSGKSGVVFVNSERFGKTMVNALRQEGMSAEYIFSDDMGASRSIISQADFAFTALGKSEILQRGIFKKGAVVIDGGIMKKDGKVSGDISREGSDEDIFLSPVPGGVGPVTVACLLRRVADLAGESIRE